MTRMDPDVFIFILVRLLFKHVAREADVSTGRRDIALQCCVSYIWVSIQPLVSTVGHLTFISVRALRALSSRSVQETVVAHTRHLPISAAWVRSVWFLSLAVSVMAVLFVTELHHAILNTIAPGSRHSRRNWLFHIYRCIEGAKSSTLAETSLKISVHLFYGGCSLHLIEQDSFGATLLGCLFTLLLMLTMTTACTTRSLASERGTFDDLVTTEKKFRMSRPETQPQLATDESSESLVPISSRIEDLKGESPVPITSRINDSEEQLASQQCPGSRNIRPTQ